jgi:hypothetical protein
MMAWKTGRRGFSRGGIAIATGSLLWSPLHFEGAKLLLIAKVQMIGKISENMYAAICLPIPRLFLSLPTSEVPPYTHNKRMPD